METKIKRNEETIMAVEVYNIISPPTEKDLSELLRAKPLSDAEIPLIIQKNIENGYLAEAPAVI